MARRANKKKGLGEWLERLRSHLDLDPLIHDCCQALMELTRADRCSIMVLEPDTGELSVRWAQGVRVYPYGKTKFRIGEGLCGWVARSQKPICSFDMEKEHRFMPAAHGGGRRFKPVKSLCCLPLVLEHRTVGVINLSSFTQGDRFRFAVQRNLPKPFLQHLAQVIEQASLLQESRAASERWRRMYQATSSSVAQVSHELRSPLALITEGIQQVLDGLLGAVDPKQLEVLRMVRGQAERMHKLVQELLDLSRIEAGRLTLYRQPLDLGQIVQEVKASYETLAVPQRLIAKLDSVDPVYGDRMRLTQVIENLMTNAIKYTPPHASITLGLAGRGRVAELSVCDTGVGMSKKEQQRLFEKFFRPKRPANTEQRGTGLGLAIVKELVQLHGGTIRVSSQPNRGTTFTVALPLYTPSFALSEEYRVMREQAAREGSSLFLQLLRSESGAPLESPEGMDYLRRYLSREDRVVPSPRDGGLLILSVTDEEGFKALRRRLAELLADRPGGAGLQDLRWGWAAVPEEGSELHAVLKLAEERSHQKRSHAQGAPESLRAGAPPG